jgi:hypothetical protein
MGEVISRETFTPIPLPNTDSRELLSSIMSDHHYGARDNTVSTTIPTAISHIDTNDKQQEETMRATREAEKYLQPEEKKEQQTEVRGALVEVNTWQAQVEQEKEKMRIAIEKEREEMRLERVTEQNRLHQAHQEKDIQVQQMQFLLEQEMAKERQRSEEIERLHKAADEVSKLQLQREEELAKALQLKEEESARMLQLKEEESARMLQLKEEEAARMLQLKEEEIIRALQLKEEAAMMIRQQQEEEVARIRLHEEENARVLRLQKEESARVLRLEEEKQTLERYRQEEIAKLRQEAVEQERVRQEEITRLRQTAEAQERSRQEEINRLRQEADERERVRSEELYRLRQEAEEKERERMEEKEKEKERMEEKEKERERMEEMQRSQLEKERERMEEMQRSQLEKERERMEEMQRSQLEKERTESERSAELARIQQLSQASSFPHASVLPAESPSSYFHTYGNSSPTVQSLSSPLSLHSPLHSPSPSPLQSLSSPHPFTTYVTEMPIPATKLISASKITPTTIRPSQRSKHANSKHPTSGTSATSISEANATPSRGSIRPSAKRKQKEKEEIVTSKRSQEKSKTLPRRHRRVKSNTPSALTSSSRSESVHESIPKRQETMQPSYLSYLPPPDQPPSVHSSSVHLQNASHSNPSPRSSNASHSEVEELLTEGDRSGEHVVSYNGKLYRARLKKKRLVEPSTLRYDQSQNMIIPTGKTTYRSSDSGKQSETVESNNNISKALKVKNPIIKFLHVNSVRPDYNNMSPQVQSNYHAELDTKMATILRYHPELGVNPYQQGMTLDQKHTIYEQYFKNVHLINGAITHKQFLMMSWVFIEGMGIKMGLKIGGFTEAQIRSMARYEEMLMEIGEESYANNISGFVGSAGEGMSPFARLAMLTLMNALIFAGFKYLGDYIPESASNMVKNFIDGSGVLPTFQNQTAPVPIGAVIPTIPAPEAPPPDYGPMIALASRGIETVMGTPAPSTAPTTVAPPVARATTPSQDGGRTRRTIPSFLQ